MPNASNEETMFGGLTSWTELVNVRPARTKVQHGEDPLCVYVVLKGRQGIRSHLMKKADAGQLAVDIFTALANLGDTKAKKLLDQMFERD
jgi:hypothetical protein